MMLETEATIGGVRVSRETFLALQAFADLVRKWSPAINLVSKASLGDLWNRHIADSAQIFSCLPPGAGHWVDLGTGGGFPGLVVAILAREHAPDLRVTLVESDQRKAAFLRQAAQALGLKLTVKSERIEALPPLRADVLSARALAPLADLLGFAERHLQAGGTALFLKGGRHGQELDEAVAPWRFDVETRPSLSDPDAAILVIRNIHRAKQD